MKKKEIYVIFKYLAAKCLLITKGARKIYFIEENPGMYYFSQ